MAEWAQKVTAAIKESHGIEITVLRNVSGSGDEWHFMTTHDSLGDMETYINSVSSDPQFQALAGEAAEMELWRVNREKKISNR